MQMKTWKAKSNKLWFKTFTPYIIIKKCSQMHKLLHLEAWKAREIEDLQIKNRFKETIVLKNSFEPLKPKQNFVQNIYTLHYYKQV